MELTAVLTHAEEGGFVANLKEATALYLEEFPVTFSGDPVITLDRAAKKRPLPKS
jgi:predicted RNase H-like HicB family nuclease